ncbi:hypothetical protein [Amycolatopsis nigrescens]|uniref:hypothetical protein n=1 Tax=Amycolatopsis nigrescens TaxID=381445 RepID=UPI0012F78F1D|nr:hypothetical protein [Amycolatopsis nigrescens]
MGLLRVELGESRPEDVENADAWVTLSDGTTWSATFLTYAELGRIMERWEKSGECLSGRYFSARPDIVILRSPGVEEMCAVIAELVNNGEYEMALQKVE